MNNLQAARAGDCLRTASLKAWDDFWGSKVVGDTFYFLAHLAMAIAALGVFAICVWLVWTLNHVMLIWLAMITALAILVVAGAGAVLLSLGAYNYMQCKRRGLSPG